MRVSNQTFRRSILVCRLVCLEIEYHSISSLEYPSDLIIFCLLVPSPVLNAWVQAGNPESAELLLDRMQQLCAEGAFDMCPNVVSFSTVING